ncbi:MAG: glucose-6-phosphate dehydrogenase assembly protein OpcA [Labilithrix sp.]|nr:glucose-6-phosphate dehydrogenase assembly protein OpcA [Labilithrix sp.]
MSGGATALIARLEKELRDLWTEPKGAGAAPMSRVCTMNLEVVAGSRELLERYMPVVDEVTASLPSRVILASIEPDAPGDEIAGSATAVCSLEAGKNICSERITLAAKGNASVRAASAMEAFLVPEIPTALVWLGRVHVDDPVFEDLASDAQRIVLDSEYTSFASVLHVAAWARKRAEAPEIADLAWTRLAPWQEMLARFFDPNETRGLADKITKLTLQQAAGPEGRLGPELALLLGWIATRLGWKASRLGGKTRFKRADGESVVVELGTVGCPQGVAPLTLAALTVDARDDTCTMHGSIDRELGTGLASGQEHTTADADVMVWKQVVTASVPAASFRLEQRVRLGANKAAKWLERTLHRPKRDAAFDESIAFAEQIAEDGLMV